MAAIRDGVPARRGTACCQNVRTIVKPSWEESPVASELLSELPQGFEGPTHAWLSRASQVRQRARLLRYPLLVTDSDLRERLYQRLRDSGLGVSKMYPHALPDIPELDKMFKRRERYPNAELFARRILTLPTHQGVTRCHVEKMQDIFMQAIG